MTALACSSAPNEGSDPIEQYRATDQRQTAHFDYYVEEGEMIDTEVIPLIEKHLHDVTAYLGIGWPQGRTISYYKVAQGESVATYGCPEQAKACYRGHVVSKDVFDQHELIHAYMAPLDYDEVLRPGFLTEGIAEALACEWTISLAKTDDLYLVEVDARSNLRARAYAGWFAAHLLNIFSPEQYLRWMSMLEHGDRYEEIAEAFEVVYGISLETAWHFTPETIPCPFVFDSKTK